MRKIGLSLIFLFAMASCVKAETAGEWLDKLYLHYNASGRLYLQFEQKTTHTLFKKTEVARGEFWADAGRYRLALPDRVEVYDGAFLWVYTPSEKEVQKQKTERASTPFRPKEILEKLKKEFNPVVVREERGVIILRLTPKRRDAAEPPVVVSFHPKSFLLGSMSWEEAGDSVTVKFVRTARDMRINPKKFAFVVPKAVKVRDISL